MTSGSSPRVVLTVLRTALGEEQRYRPRARYGELVQKHSNMPVWRHQVVTWLYEVRV
jgi:hypothetical protein